MELLLYAVIFSMVQSSQMPQANFVPSLLHPLIQILLGRIRLGPLCVKKIFIWIPALSGLGHWPSLISSEKKQILLRCKHWRIILYLIFPSDFYLTISLGWAAHSLWLSLPLAACGGQNSPLGLPTQQPLLLCLSALAFQSGFRIS